jgi:hypothetical protein
VEPPATVTTELPAIEKLKPNPFNRPADFSWDKLDDIQVRNEFQAILDFDGKRPGIINLVPTENRATVTEAMRDFGKRIDSLAERHPEFVEKVLKKTETKSIEFFEGTLKFQDAKGNTREAYGLAYWNEKKVEIGVLPKDIPQSWQPRTGQWSTSNPLGGSGEHSHAATLAHEWGHIVDINMFGVQGMQTGRTAFTDIYFSQPNSYWETTVTRYAAENPQELFAESFAIYSKPSYAKGSLPKLIEDRFEQLFGPVR